MLTCCFSSNRREDLPERISKIKIQTLKLERNFDQILKVQFLLHDISGISFKIPSIRIVFVSLGYSFFTP